MATARGRTGNTPETCCSQCGMIAQGTKTPEMNISGNTAAVATGCAESNDLIRPATAKPRTQNTTTPIATATRRAGTAAGATVAPYATRPTTRRRPAETAPVKIVVMA